MQVVYISKNFSRENIEKSYIAFDVYGETLKQYDVNAAGYTIKESIVYPENFNQELVTKALNICGQAFKQVLVYSKV